MAIKVLGVSGSALEDSNTGVLLQEALDEAARLGGEAEAVSLAGLDINDCRQCNWCLLKQTPEKYCSLEDDMAGLYPKVAAADVVILASPVYIGRLAGRLAVFLDRLRAVHYGKANPAGLKYKVGAGLAVAWFRHSGVETTLLSLHHAFCTFQMLPATPGSLCTFGGGAVSSLGGSGDFDPKDKRQVRKDEFGLKTARETARAAMDLAGLVQRGRG